MSKCAGTPSTSSQPSSLTACRKTPRRCARQTYSTSAPRSAAITFAILFSNPSRFSLEKGRLFGSAAMRRTRRGVGASTFACAATGRRWSLPAQPHTSSVRAIAQIPSRKREHIQRASLRGGLGQVLHGADESEGRGGVARVEPAGDDRAGPAAHARQDRDVLLTVRPLVRRRLADDP